MRKPALIFVLILSLVVFSAKQAQANPPRIVRGVVKTVSSVLEIPAAIVQDSRRVIFPVGVLTGTVRGTVRTVTSLLGGIFDIATGALPYAKYAAAFV